MEIWKVQIQFIYDVFLQKVVLCAIVEWEGIQKENILFINVLPSIYGKGYYKGYCIEQKHVATKMDHKPMVDDKKNICLNFSQSMLFTKKQNAEKM